MFTAIGQYVGAKVITALLVVGSAASVIWFWKHPEQLEAIWSTIKYVLVWLGVILALPWAGFFVMPWVLSKDSNLAGAFLLVGFAATDVLVALFLMGGLFGHGMLTWMVLLIGFLSASVYNFKVCEHQVERLEEG